MTNPPRIVWIVKRPGTFIENVILPATSREYAKSHASHILGGNPDHYVVEPLTSAGARTVFLTDVN